MWIKLLLMFAPDLESLLKAVIGISDKTATNSKAAAGELAGQAADLQRQSDAHLIKANQAATVVAKLQGIFN